MRTDTPKTIYLKDYKPYPYDVKTVDLNFDIHDGYTDVTSRLEIIKKESAPLFLYGEELELQSITLNGEDVDYTADDASMTISEPAEDAFTLEIKTRIKPEENTRLEGLYMSGGNYCTQCEAEGFRRITYFPDRPDVLSVFTVRVEADKSFPVLLSNGNRIDGDELENGRHFTVWEDPFPKPCYLFALVAGDLAHVHDTFTTQSGNEVDLFIYVREGDQDQCAHAMESLKKSMKWDEDTYGREYEHEVFNIVAVSDFNMGAMENTSLNIFNTALVLAAQETATDQDFLRVEGVIAHEYFHNWTGNRVTCRDWFQLSLKEGLTVFRDQEFSADMNSRSVQRIDDVAQLRRLQFPEDAGPLAHPIRPDNYIEINNFYTMTVYEKGAEVIRMFHTLLGPETYRKATDLYFDRYDGMAVTCEDWAQCMEDASGQDLSQFKLWYSQAGTPEIDFKGTYSEADKSYTIELSQKIPPTPKQDIKKTMHIPVSIGLLGDNGHDLIETKVLHLKEGKQSFVIDNIAEKPTPSILRNFSSPVKLSTDLSTKDLAFLMIHDSDGFNRWEASQNLHLGMINALMEQAEKGGKPQICPHYMKNVGYLLEQALEPNADKALLARMIALPNVSYVGQQHDIADPPAIHEARETIIKAMKREHRKVLDKIYKTTTDTGAFSITPDAMGNRALRNLVLGILSSTHGTGCARRSKEHYDNANNMTDRVAALSVLAPMSREENGLAFDDFYERFKDQALVIDKYFALQAAAVRTDIIQNIKKLRQHPDFNIKNPNRVRSLYAAFAMNNPVCFHAEDGSGYAFLADAIIELNDINPQIAARLLTPMREWKRYSVDRQEKMKTQLERILKIENIAPDVFEIASKSLKG